MSTFEDSRLTELISTSKLGLKQRGELAELAFMRKAASLGFAVAKPWGDSDRYDVIVRYQSTFWRVQVKSVLGLQPSRTTYRVNIKAGHNNIGYTVEEIPRTLGTFFRRPQSRTRPPCVSTLRRQSAVIGPTAKRGTS